VLYVDDRQVSRVYEMYFEGGEWKIWRNAPGFYQRFAGKLDKGRKTIKARGENSTDGEKWNHDFDVTYTRE